MTARLLRAAVSLAGACPSVLPAPCFRFIPIHVPHQASRHLHLLTFAFAALKFDQPLNFPSDKMEASMVDHELSWLLLPTESQLPLR